MDGACKEHCKMIRRYDVVNGNKQLFMSDTLSSENKLDSEGKHVTSMPVTNGGVLLLRYTHVAGAVRHAVIL